MDKNEPWWENLDMFEFSDEISFSFFQEPHNTVQNLQLELQVEFTPKKICNGHKKVPFPIDIVLNKNVMVEYNRVFVFLVQIKRAKYVLESVDRRLTSRRFHGCLLLKSKLLHFVNNLQHFIVNRVSQLGFSEIIRRCCKVSGRT